MNEHYEDALQELKRADHLIFVSLKYTRTIDVFISIFERLVNYYGNLCDSLLLKARDEGKIDMIPVSPMLKVAQINSMYPSEEVSLFTEFYLFLRKVLKSDYDKAREFRRHVTMTSYYEKDKKMEITTDLIEEWFSLAKQRLDLVKAILYPGDE